MAAAVLCCDPFREEEEVDTVAEACQYSELEVPHSFTHEYKITTGLHLIPGEIMVTTVCFMHSNWLSPVAHP